MTEHNVDQATTLLALLALVGVLVLLAVEAGVVG